MKNRLRVPAIVLFLCGLVAGGLAVWLYTRARAQADEGMALQKKALQLYDQSDAYKGTPEEDRLVAEAQRNEQDGDTVLASARATRFWAMTSGIATIVLVLAFIITILTHLRRKETDPPA
ncbi:MAG TPA: hypothetical protein VJT74_13280 [Pyrinomonadaceae bacterium]|nr:hypothetical protein [Pyrinomonadaceae bacterium]